jgi:hypothetical protein
LSLSHRLHLIIVAFATIRHGVPVVISSLRGKD